jgi:hypothetical protein
LIHPWCRGRISNHRRWPVFGTKNRPKNIIIRKTKCGELATAAGSPWGASRLTTKILSSPVIRAATAVQPEGSLRNSGSTARARQENGMSLIWRITFQDVIICPQKRPLETLLVVSVLVALFSGQALEHILSRVLGNARACLRSKNYEDRRSEMKDGAREMTYHHDRRRQRRMRSLSVHLRLTGVPQCARLPCLIEIKRRGHAVFT